jgi:hypothetical protein
MEPQFQQRRCTGSGRQITEHTTLGPLRYISVRRLLAQ